jgi:hypothetical protein
MEELVGIDLRAAPTPIETIETTDNILTSPTPSVFAAGNSRPLINSENTYNIVNYGN